MCFKSDPIIVSILKSYFLYCTTHWTYRYMVLIIPAAYIYIISRLIVQKNSRACAVLTLRITWLQKSSSSGLFLQHYVFILSVFGRWWNVWHRCNQSDFAYNIERVFTLFLRTFSYSQSSITYTFTIRTFFRKNKINNVQRFLMSAYYMLCPI